MDRSAQLEALRTEHAAAVERYDFDLAEVIDQRIKQLRTELSREASSTCPEMLTLDLDVQRERILDDSAQDTSTLLQMEIDLQARFHRRYQQLQERHKQQLADLAQSHAQELERELTRTTPELEYLLQEAKRFGRIHDYAQARASYRTATALRERLNNRRREACDAAFFRNRQKLKEKQDWEMQLLAEKRDAAIGRLDQLTTQRRSVISTRMKLNEMKCAATMNRRPPATPQSARRPVSEARLARSQARNLNGSASVD
jgi:hypothetical protein